MIGCRMVPLGVVALLLAGCAESPDVAQGPQAPARSASPSPKAKVADELVAALEQWNEFPVEARPRPLLILRKTRGGGWKTGEAKEAFGMGDWKTPAQVAAGPDEFAGYPVIGAREALKILRDEESDGRTGAATLTIEKMELVTVPGVLTDRGERPLPAWRFDFGQASQPLFVVAVAESAQYIHRPETTFYPYGGVLGTEADTDMTVSHGGAADEPGPCGADYRIETAESDHAVAFRVVAIERPEPEAGDEPVACNAMLYGRKSPMTLTKPLGSRVLLSVGAERVEPTPLVAPEESEAPEMD